MGMGLRLVRFGSLASDRGIGLVTPEPMAREVINVTGKPISTVQFPKGQTGQMPVESKKKKKVSKPHMLINK